MCGQSNARPETAGAGLGMNCAGCGTWLPVPTGPDPSAEPPYPLAVLVLDESNLVAAAPQPLPEQDTSVVSPGQIPLPCEEPAAEAVTLVQMAQPSEKINERPVTPVEIILPFEATQVQPVGNQVGERGAPDQEKRKRPGGKPPRTRKTTREPRVYQPFQGSNRPFMTGTRLLSLLCMLFGLGVFIFGLVTRTDTGAYDAGQIVGTIFGALFCIVSAFAFIRG